ncbi:MAG: hypothetical protein ACTSQI_21195 [Candidatus Helarchaeota archaeon]
MPVGIFLIEYDEIVGAKIKSSYFKVSFEVSQEFVSLLYSSHAESIGPVYIEMMFSTYQTLSYSSNVFAGQNQNKYILGIVFDEHENLVNLELFLRRHLTTSFIENNAQNMEGIFQELLKHLELGRYFEVFEIQNIPAIFVIRGTDEFEVCLLNIGVKFSNLEIGTIYPQMLKGEQLPHLEYIRLNLEKGRKYFLVFQIEKYYKIISKMLLILATYLEYYFEYSLELLALFLLPSQLKLSPLKTQLYKKYPDNKPLLQVLQKARNYQAEFNSIIESMMNSEVYPTPLTT